MFAKSNMVVNGKSQMFSTFKIDQWLLNLIHSQGNSIFPRKVMNAACSSGHSYSDFVSAIKLEETMDMKLEESQHSQSFPTKHAHVFTPSKVTVRNGPQGHAGDWVESPVQASPVDETMDHTLQLSPEMRRYYQTFDTTVDMGVTFDGLTTQQWGDEKQRKDGFDFRKTPKHKRGSPLKRVPKSEIYKRPVTTGLPEDTRPLETAVDTAAAKYQDAYSHLKANDGGRMEGLEYETLKKDASKAQHRWREFVFKSDRTMYADDPNDFLDEQHRKDAVPIEDNLDDYLVRSCV